MDFPRNYGHRNFFRLYLLNLYTELKDGSFDHCLHLVEMKKVTQNQLSRSTMFCFNS